MVLWVLAYHRYGVVGVHILSRPHGAWAFHELRRYHNRPLRLNWGPENVHFGKRHFWDLNINVRIFKFEYDVSWSPRSNDHFDIWEPILNPIWVPGAWNRPQKGLNIEINGNFSQPYSLLGSFLTKTNVFLTRLKITWVDPHVPTIILPILPILNPI